MRIEEIERQLDAIVPCGLHGRVVRTQGMIVSVAGLPAPVGAQVELRREGGSPIRGEVIGFRDHETIIYPYEELHGVRQGDRVSLGRSARFLPVGPKMIGRVLDALGRPIDGLPAPTLTDRVPLSRKPPNAVERPRIDRPISTGVRALDAMLTCGLGQRMGIFAGAGVGKSVTLGMMARDSSADVNVIALIGERGREVNDFLERDLGPEGRARSVVIVATGDEPALLRVQAALAATAIAEYFRDAGKNVLLMMDSLTRFAMAQREIGLAAGEPPTTRGYPPSVFALLPRLVERAGRSRDGSITAFYSVLVEGDDPSEPIADTVRGLLDGHTYLSRKLAGRGHFPAIDILQSISRVMTDIAEPNHLEAARRIREFLSAYRDNEDLITIGAYRQGSNPLVDAAIRHKDPIDRFLRQGMEERADGAGSIAGLVELARRCGVALPGTAPTATAPAAAVQGQNNQPPGAAASKPTAAAPKPAAPARPAPARPAAARTADAAARPN